ncbi:unnamed protein product [Diamesa hyperborea]
MEYFVISVIFLLFSLAYLFFHKKYQYWSDLGVPQFTPVDFFYGNFKGKEFHIKEKLMELYSQIKESNGFGGIYLYLQSIFVVADLDLVKHILIKDFNTFPNRGHYFNEVDDPLSANLFNIEDEQWKNLRNKFSPTFSSGKIKMMFPIVLDVADKMIVTLDKESSTSGQLDIKDLLARFTTDVIGSVAFGIECNSLNDNTAKFYEMGTRNFSKPASFFKRAFRNSYKSLARKLHMKMLPEKVAEFYLNITKETVQYREQHPEVKRHDFMNLLIEMKDSLTMNQIAAQSFIFYAGGFESSSTTMTYCLYELSLNQELQDKTRKSIRAVVEKHQGQFTYEAVNEMHFVEQCVNETLRKYPTVSNLQRSANKDYLVPSTKITLPKGTPVWIPVHAIHHDPEIYPEPAKYDPDRFNPEEVAKRHQYSFLPFGEGPRVCIGMRFGLMETKIGLAKLLLNYQFTLDRSKTSVPLKISPSKIILTPDELIYVNVEKLNYSTEL